MHRISDFESLDPLYESPNTVVYRAIRAEDRLPVILKRLKKDHPSPADLTRYRREYEIVRKLSQTAGVARVYGLTKTGSGLGLCFEDIGGESLKSRIEKQPALEFGKLLSLAFRITAILGRIHAQRVMHKDINPSNLIYNSTRFSSQTPALKHPDSLEGTLAYMSPEQTGRINRSVDY